MQTRFWLTTSLIVVLCSPNARAEEASTGPDNACRSRTVKTKIDDIHKHAQTVLEIALRPGTKPEDWKLPFDRLLADSILLVGLCEEPAVIARGCPLCQAPADIEISATTAPAMLVQWMLDRPIFTGAPAPGAANPANAAN